MTIADYVIAFLLWTFIVFVSSYDVYWSIVFADTLPQDELNPLGIWLMSLGEGVCLDVGSNHEVAFFMAVKVFCSAIVFAVIPILYFYKRWWGHSVSTSLAVHQAWLFWMLTFA